MLKHNDEAVDESQNDKAQVQISCSEMTDYRSTELFVGNLSSDVEHEYVVEKLQSLFATAGIDTNAGDYSALKRGPKKAKHLFVTLRNGDQCKELIKQFDGLTELDFITANKSLRITEKKQKCVKSRKSKKKKVRLKNDENFEKVLIVADPKLKLSKSAPTIVSDLGNDLRNNIVEPQNDPCLQMGQVLRNEDRKTEYKRGGGKYLKKNLINHVRKYVCAFLNSEGGRLLIGVADNGKVYGLACLRQEEDKIRIQIDNVISRFQPPVLPAMYSVSFIPVIPSNIEYKTRDYDDQCFKVLEIEIHQLSIKKTLFETDRGDVYVRRDGSVQGPLKASQIIEWCRLNEVLGRIQGTEKLTAAMAEDAVTNQGLKSDADSAPYKLQARSSKSVGIWTNEHESMMRINKLEASIASRQAQIEREIDAIKCSYESREKALQEELEKSRLELRKQSRPKSAVCNIL